MDEVQEIQKAVIFTADNTERVDQASGSLHLKNPKEDKKNDANIED